MPSSKESLVYAVIRRINPYTDYDVLVGLFHDEKAADEARRAYVAATVEKDPWSERLGPSVDVDSDTQVSAVEVDDRTANQLFLVLSCAECFGQRGLELLRGFKEEADATAYSEAWEEATELAYPAWTHTLLVPLNASSKASGGYTDELHSSAMPGKKARGPAGDIGAPLPTPFDGVTVGPFNATFHKNRSIERLQRALADFIRTEAMPAAASSGADVRGHLRARRDEDRFCGPNSAVKNDYELSLRISTAQGEQLLEATLRYVDVEEPAFVSRRAVVLTDAQTEDERRREDEERKERQKIWLDHVASVRVQQQRVSVTCPLCRSQMWVIDEGGSIFFKCSCYGMKGSRGVDDS